MSIEAMDTMAELRHRAGELRFRKSQVHGLRDMVQELAERCDRAEATNKDMLAALEYAVCEPWSPDIVFSIISAAIAKAKGETK